jgi:hypothetical protein
MLADVFSGTSKLLPWLAMHHEQLLANIFGMGDDFSLKNFDATKVTSNNTKK